MRLIWFLIGLGVSNVAFSEKETLLELLADENKLKNFLGQSDSFEEDERLFAKNLFSNSGLKEERDLHGRIMKELLPLISEEVNKSSLAVSIEPNQEIVFNVLINPNGDLESISFIGFRKSGSIEAPIPNVLMQQHLDNINHHFSFLHGYSRQKLRVHANALWIQSPES